MAIQKNTAPQRRRYGGLDVIEFTAEPSATTIVFFHGYGANDADLAPLALEIPLPRPARWVFPNAPLKLDSEGFSRAWFPIDAERIEQGQRTGKAVDFSQSEPSGLAEVRKMTDQFLASLNVPWEQLILGGFSQGSMLAVDLALRAPENPRGLVILSGNLINEKSWKDLAPKRASLPFFQSHGIADPILGYQGARKLETLLQQAGLSGKLLSFEGGHAIPSDAFAALSRFLAGLS